MLVVRGVEKEILPFTTISAVDLEMPASLRAIHSYGPASSGNTSGMVRVTRLLRNDTWKSGVFEISLPALYHLTVGSGLPEEKRKDNYAGSPLGDMNEILGK